MSPESVAALERLETSTADAPPAVKESTPRTRGEVGLPDHPWLMADEGYPVSGDRIALHLSDRHPQNLSVTGRQLSRVPLGDVLWGMLAAMPHPGRP